MDLKTLKPGDVITVDFKDRKEIAVFKKLTGHGHVLVFGGSTVYKDEPMNIHETFISPEVYESDSEISLSTPEEKEIMEKAMLDDYNVIYNPVIHALQFWRPNTGDLYYTFKYDEEEMFFVPVQKKFGENPEFDEEMKNRNWMFRTEEFASMHMSCLYDVMREYNESITKYALSNNVIC